MKKKVLVVEDEDSIRTGLVDLLAFKGYAPFAVADGQKALEAIDTTTFQIMLIDVMLPFVDGFTVCAHARRIQQKSGIIMLTAKSQEEDIVQGFEAGCDDYVTKPFSLKPLLLRISALARRLGTPASVGGLVLHPETLRVTYREASIEVSARDMEVLCYLFSSQDRIVKRAELLHEIWGYRNPRDVQTRCVDMHITKLRRKLGVLLPDWDLIRTVRGVGYRMEAPSR
jgi:DNA-binding response OmpR family regulator